MGEHSLRLRCRPLLSHFLPAIQPATTHIYSIRHGHMCCISKPERGPNDKSIVDTMVSAFGHIKRYLRAALVESMDPKWNGSPTVRCPSCW